MVFASTWKKALGTGRIVSINESECNQCSPWNYKRQQTFRAKVVAQLPETDCDRIMSYVTVGTDNLANGWTIPLSTGWFVGSSRMGWSADYLNIVTAGNYRYDVSYTLSNPWLTSAYIDIYAGATRIARFLGVAVNNIVQIAGTWVSLLQSNTHLTARISLTWAATADVLWPNSEYQGVFTVQKL